MLVPFQPITFLIANLFLCAIGMSQVCFCHLSKAQSGFIPIRASGMSLNHPVTLFGVFYCSVQENGPQPNLGKVAAQAVTVNYGTLWGMFKKKWTSIQYWFCSKIDAICTITNKLLSSMLVCYTKASRFFTFFQTSPTNHATAFWGTDLLGGSSTLTDGQNMGPSTNVFVQTTGKVKTWNDHMQWTGLNGKDLLMTKKIGRNRVAFQIEIKVSEGLTDVILFVHVFLVYQWGAESQPKEVEIELGIELKNNESAKNSRIKFLSLNRYGCFLEMVLPNHGFSY